MPTPKFRHALAHSYRHSHGAGRSPRALQCLKASWPATTWQIAGAKGRSRSFTTTQRTAKGLADETKKHLNKQGATEAIYEACSVEERIRPRSHRPGGAISPKAKSLLAPCSVVHRAGQKRPFTSMLSVECHKQTSFLALESGSDRS
jgi:hypothetical protein